MMFQLPQTMVTLDLSSKALGNLLNLVKKLTDVRIHAVKNSGSVDGFSRELEAHGQGRDEIIQG